jgi:hypothetical protein
MRDLQPRDPSVHIVFADLTQAIETYWAGLSHLQNILEDVRGADRRIDYLYALRFRLIGVAAMIGEVATHGRVVSHKDHLAGVALERGLPFFGIDATMLAESIGLCGKTLSPEELERRLIALGRHLLAALPGHLPEAQGPGGQRQVIAAMRAWSTAASTTGTDLGFLADRLKEI